MSALELYSQNVEACIDCLKEKGVKCRGHCPCPVDPDNRTTSDHAKSGYCPERRYHANIDRPERWEKTPAQFSDRQVIGYRRAWAELHRRALSMIDAASERHWLDTRFTPRVKCGPCKDGWLKILAVNSPDFTSPRAYFLWTHKVHNLVNAAIDKPQLSPARAARIHGVTHLLTSEELAADTAPVKLLVSIDWSLGDEVIATSAIRDLMAACPGEYEISVACKSPEVFEGLGVSVVPEEKPDLVWRFEVQYEPHVHFITYARHQLERVINRPIAAGPLRPHLVLSEAELAAPPLVDSPYIVAAFGGKQDCTCKIWVDAYWQEVVDHYKNKFQFVAVGSNGPADIQPKIGGTIDMVGKTTIREIFRLIAHSNCIAAVSGITSVLHIAQAFQKPMVCIAGAREQDWVARYPNIEWLRSRPPCQNCWRLRVRKLELP